MTALFHLAASVSGSWYMLAVLGHLNRPEPLLMLLVTLEQDKMMNKACGESCESECVTSGGTVAGLHVISWGELSTANGAENGFSVYWNDRKTLYTYERGERMFDKGGWKEIEICRR